MVTKEELLKTIQVHNEAYRAGKAMVSDAIYDNEVELLRKLDPNNSWFHHIEPVKVKRERRIKLPIPMRSLYKVKDYDALHKWIFGLNTHKHAMFVVMPKYDGVSLLVNEQTGMAYSRGGADNEGQDCSEYYAKIGENGCTNARLKFTYGEVVFKNKVWMKHFKGRINAESGDPYKSPRNTVAGFLNRNNVADELVYTSFVRYGADEESLNSFCSFADLLDYITNAYHQPSLYRLVEKEDMTDQFLYKLYSEWCKEYFIDGLVVYVDDIDVWRRVGRQETTGNPLYAIAYKNPDFTEVHESTVTDIIWKHSKSNTFKPVVKIAPVETKDCIIENITGYNARYIYNNKITKGTKVLFARSGEVIPKLIKIYPSDNFTEFNKMWADLKHCPDCGSPTMWNANEVELMCSNPKCPSLQLAKLIFFFNTIGVDNVKNNTLTKLYNEGYNTVRKILDVTFEEMMNIDGFGEIAANNILNGINTIKNGVEVTLLMQASGCFNNIGRVTAKKILGQMTEEERYSFINGCSAVWRNEEELRASKTFQSTGVVLQNFLLGIKPFYQFIAENHLIVLPMDSDKKSSGGKLAGFKVCFTGFRDYDLEQSIINAGGEIADGLTKRTTHLITKAHLTLSRKADTAIRMGIPILTPSEFKDMYGIM